VPRRPAEARLRRRQRLEVAADRLDEHQFRETRTMQELSITTFRYVPRDLRAHVGEQSVERHLDALNRELVDRLQRGGEAFVSNAIVGGRYVLRACVVNFHTNRGDVEAVPEIAARIGRTVDAELRANAQDADPA
jgi:aromatic-L-amino-acid decarboxylase